MKMINTRYDLPAGGTFGASDLPNRNGSYEDRVMAVKFLHAPEALRQLLRYEPETGQLFWLESRAGQHGFNKQYMGREALAGKHPDGYKQGTLSGKSVLAHRVVWAVVYGAWPIEDIDHINGNRQDNRIENLRAVSRMENAHNVKRRSTNKSGHAGVYWSPSNGKWVAQIMCAGRREWLGLFTTVADAAVARRDAERRYGFHENHGREK